MNRPRKTVPAATAALLGLASAVSLANPLPNPLTFTQPILIEGPNGTATVGIDINNSGLVVGQFEAVPTQIFRAFSWAPNQGLVELETNGALVNSSANAVNDCFDIAGEASLTSGNPHAVRWVGGEVEDLGTLTGGSTSIAFGINERGNVVGVSETAQAGVIHAFLWTETTGRMRDLGVLPGFHASVARSVNNKNEVVGVASTTTGAINHAFFWSAATGMIDLGTLGFQNSDAFDINEAGQVVGVAFSALGTKSKTFKWTHPTGMVALGDFGNHLANARGLNGSGHIVGEALDDSRIRRATFWLPSKQAVNIDPNTGISSGASAINDRGQIVGQAAFSNPNDSRAAVWRIRNFQQRGSDITAKARICQQRQ